MEHTIIKVKGRNNKYMHLTAEQGYCFYNLNDEDKVYSQSLFTPILDETELDKTYIVVQGNADQLNEELQKAREVQDGDQ